ncbi:MAG: tryptophan 2,3-dioxygenase [Myxococcales bacterium]|nr:tryptophan 2,3-dioxygenase [Myxococcales bacterium]
MTEGLIEPEKGQLTYNNYLKVDELIGLQNLQSDPPQHDETLFIIIHQAYELWFKQILHEVSAIIDFLKNDDLLAVFKSCRRVIRIQDLLIKQVDILETMTPNDFNHFRALLNPASGFQSAQFRVFEFQLGLKRRSYLRYHSNDPVATVALNEALDAPTLYDHVLACLDRLGLDIPREILERDISKPHAPSDDLARVFGSIYRNSEDNYHVYLLLELLLDIDQKLISWRWRHVSMVERIIGHTIGTGGSMGVDYLTSTLKKRCFPEIWSARKYVITDLSERPGSMGYSGSTDSELPRPSEPDS